MARHPILSEQLSKQFLGLFKRAPKRVAPSRNRRMNSRPLAVKFQSKKKQTASKPSKPTKVSTDQASNPQSHSGKSLKPGTVLLNLFWVRPWLLVIALWLTFVLMIAIALAGLSNPGREMVMAPVSSSIVGQPLSAPDAAAVSRLNTQNERVITQHDPAATLPGAAEKSMPAWPLLLMVAACAGGCMMMSRQGVSEPQRGRRRVAVTPRSGVRSNNIRPDSPVRSVGKRHRRAKHRRLGAQRPASQVMTFNSSGQTLHHTPTQQPPTVSKSVSFAVNGEVAPSTSSSVSIVPDDESSPLDWKEGSLAHKLDVRQTRSINSFL